MPRSARRFTGSTLAALQAIFAVGVSWIACGSGPSAPRPDLVLITVDTLRADFVHSYGFSQETTPHLDALAARGVLFEAAIAASTATVPAHASMMTSRYVREHSVGAQNGPTRLEGVTTLAERLQEAGYETAAFVSNVVLKARTGLDRGFDHYDDELPAAEANRDIYFERVASETAARAQAWLAQPRSGPRFLWVHLQDPHGPYTPPEAWREQVADVPMRTDRELPVLRNNRGRGGIPDYQAVEGVRTAPRYAGLYAGEIAFTDHWIGELVASAESVAGDAGVFFVVTADHGESLDEDGFYFQHGHATTPEQARVPLVVAGPGVSPHRVAGVASHVDLAPTLLELAGQPPPEGARGISLVAALRGGASLPDRAVLTDIGHELSAYDAAGYLTVKVLAEGKLDWQRYRRVVDGYQKVDLASLDADLVRYIGEQVPTVPALAMSEADLERLRALGYLPPVAPAANARAPAANEQEK